jgi:2-polyprenyl-3-methyl-5-hydroxy-6-metoxy-1,4-benzoquinol methylase
VPRTPVGRREHWDAKYASTAVSDVSWFQASPEQSRRLLAGCGVGRHHSVLDVGGGASSLAETLIEDGWTDVTVLDVSSEALAAARARCAEPERIQWLNEDLLQWTPDRAYDVWHDRAVFHFLVEESDVATYRQKLRAALVPGGIVVVATFAAGGPTQCSGLPVHRYAADELVEALGAGLTPVETAREEHRTPSGAVQPFTWVALRRDG